MRDLFPSLAKPSSQLLEELRSDVPAIAGGAFELLQAEVAPSVEAQILATIRRSVSHSSVRMQLVEDAAAETWCAVIHHRKRFTGDDLEAFRRWVCGIARNKACQTVREAFGRRECPFLEGLEPTDGGLATDAIEENVVLKTALVEALDRAQLPPKQRLHAVLVLEAYFAGCATAVDAYLEAAEAADGAGWMRVKEVWLEVRKRLRVDPGLVSATERGELRDFGPRASTRQKLPQTELAALPS